MKAIRRMPVNGEYVKFYNDNNLYMVEAGQVFKDGRKTNLDLIHYDIEYVYNEHFEQFRYIGTEDEAVFLPLQGTTVYVIREYNALRQKRVEKDVIKEYGTMFFGRDDDDIEEDIVVRLEEYPACSVPIEEFGKTIFLRKEHAEKHLPPSESF